MFCEQCGEKDGHAAGCPNAAEEPELPERIGERLPAAPVGRRLATSSLEYILLMIGIIAIAASGALTAFASHLVLPILAVYWGVRGLKGGRYSPGKRLGRFRVVDAKTGQLATDKQCVLRNSYYVALILLAALPFWSFFNMFLVGLVMLLDVTIMIATPENRRIGDMIAGTQAVPVED